MTEISSGAAQDLFFNWEHQNRRLAVIGSNPSFVVSLRKARVTICLQDQLQLICGDDSIVRLFVRGALFSPADPKDFPGESAAWSAEFEPGVQIRFVHTQTQCFIFPEHASTPAQERLCAAEYLDILPERDIVGVRQSGLAGLLEGNGTSIMPDLNETVANGLAAYYEYVAQDLHKWVDPLTNEQFWRKPYPYGNSVGHLVLHLTGNLSYYIGARIAGTGYVRDRDREFTDAHPPRKEEALRAFDQTVAMVVATIREERAEDWGKSYTADREPEAEDHFQILVRCAGHAYHHMGQIVYLSRELART